MAPELTLHVLTMSHPCRTAEAALRYKGLDFELAALTPGPHVEVMTEVYGKGNTSVPGLVVDGEAVHGSRSILARLEELKPDPPLFPEPNAERIREAEEWGDVEFQELGRLLAWGALYFRPEAMGTFTGGESLDPAGVDFAMRFVRGTWRHHSITAERIATALAGLPEKMAHIDALASDGLIGGEEPTAADLQIGSTARILLTIRDLDEHLLGTSAETIARRWFADYPGEIPAGAFPAGWVPAAA